MNVQTQPLREIQLGEGRYNMTVVNIVESVKQFSSRNGLMTRHDIYFQTEQGMGYRGEYITAEPYQSEFMVGEMCCIQVTNAKMREISKRPDSSLLIAKPGQQQNGAPAEELHGVKVEGSTQAIALQMAVQLASAHVRVGLVNSTEPDFMVHLLENAWKFNEWLLDPKQPEPF